MMRPVGCPETAVAKYKSTLPDITEDLTYKAAGKWNHVKILFAGLDI